MDLNLIRKKLLSISPFVKDAEIVERNGSAFALIHPNFEKLKKANVINVESEIRWYSVEEYNLEAKEECKIRGYEIVPDALDMNEEEPKDETYRVLKRHTQTLSDNRVFFSSHLELDLGLDSLDYVELFVFIQMSFGVEIDEAKFSKIMLMRELYEYVKTRQEYVNPSGADWSEILKEPVDEKLIYSPRVMFLYKIVLLALFKPFFRLEARGKENIPQSSCVIAPTHQSMLDGFLIEATLPFSVLKRTFFLAYKRVFGTNVMKPIAKHGQSILIDANENLRRTMLYASLPLRESMNLVIFPEGARSRDGNLLEFRPFFAMLSQTFNVPIVPVAIEGSFEALRSGSIFPKPKKIRVTYLKPIYPEGLSYEEIVKRVRDAIEKELALRS